MSLLFSTLLAAATLGTPPMNLADSSANHAVLVAREYSRQHGVFKFFKQWPVTFSIRKKAWEFEVHFFLLHLILDDVGQTVRVDCRSYRVLGAELDGTG